MNPRRKVGIIGTGHVGMSCAYALMIRGIANEMVLVDAMAERALGEAMDLNHGLSFTRPMKISTGTIDDLAGCAVVVITAGVSQKQGETRLALLGRNAAIFRDLVPRVVSVNPDGIILIATNPVDILTYISMQDAGLDRSRIIGSGTILDTSRFRFLLGQYYGVDARSVHAYIVGEHGDSEIPLWSLATIGGVRLQEFTPLAHKPYDTQAMEGIFIAVRDAAYEIIRRKGATYYAIGLGLVSIIDAILGDHRSVLSVSTFLDGQYGISDVCLSIPCIVGARGVEEILALPVSGEELRGLKQSAEKLKTTYSSLSQHEESR
jgi:L-lactate dehydrogenase